MSSEREQTPWEPPQWGLAFESAEGDVRELEATFWRTRSQSHQSTAAVLSAGVALVHGLLAFKLHSQGQPSLALAAAGTMGQQLLVWLLAVLTPALFSRLRPLLYAFSVTFPAVQSSPLFSSSMSVVSCGSPASPAFWISQLLASGVPWLVVHAVLFPLTINQGLVVHGLATLLLLSSNRQRCAAVLEQCPAAGPLLARVATAMQGLSIFSASSHSWLVTGGNATAAAAAAAVAGGPAVAGSGGGAAAAAAGAAEAAISLQHLRSCMAVFGTLQVAVGYLAVLQLAWWLERAARLAFLRHTEEVEAEWRLEKKGRPPGSLLLEVAALLLLSWQLVDGWMALGAAGGAAAAAAGAPAGAVPPLHGEL
ncbi:hypothetical protein ABPG75_001564 [Micractinium tetrahymenae]